jgi:GNAT superfamily N-acetyltransferase
MPIVELGGGELAAGLADRICQLYDAVFSAPPFTWSPGDSDEHRRMLTDLLADKTFAIAVAREGGELAGFAYGCRLPVTHGWWGGFPQPLPAAFTAEREGRTYTLTDFAVEPALRGRGIGRQLHDALLDSREEERAVLSVQPTALATQQIYLHWGWRHVGRKGPLADAHPPYWDIYVRSLATPGSAGGTA